MNENDVKTAYQYQMMRRAQTAQAFFAMTRAWAEMAGGEGRHHPHSRVEKIDIHKISDFIRQADMITNEWPEAKENPDEWKSIQDIFDGIGRIEKNLRLGDGIASTISGLALRLGLDVDMLNARA